MNEDPRNEPLLFAEYQGRHPFSATTLSRSGGVHHWDIEWCRRDRASYFTLSGCGGPADRVALNRVVGAKPGAVRIWTAREVLLTSNSDKPRRLTRAAAELLGYSFFARRPRPFASAIQDETAYCERCEDRLPVSHVCEHLGFCIDCGDWYSTAFLKHRWHDRDPAQLELARTVHRPAPVYCRTTRGVWGRYLERRDRLLTGAAKEHRS